MENKPQETTIPTPNRNDADDIVSTPRLLLERLEVDKHLDDFHEIWNNAEAVIWSTKPKKETVEESREWFLFLSRNDVNPEIDKFAILLKDERKANGEMKMIGMVGTNRWNEEGMGMEVGYCLNIAYWGKGYASESFQAFMEFFWTLPERKNMKRLVALTSPGNVASQKVLEKCGARKAKVSEKVYARWVDRDLPEEERKTDVWCWFLDRPGTDGEGGDVGKRDQGEKLEVK